MYHLFLSSSSLLLLLNKFLQYNALLKLTSSFKRTEGRSGDTGTSNTPANISCFPRRLQRNTFHLPRRLQDVFKTYLQYVFLKRLQDVFKTCLQDVFKTSWKTKKCYTEDVLKTSSVRLHQDECLLEHLFKILFMKLLPLRTQYSFRTSLNPF